MQHLAIFVPTITPKSNPIEGKWEKMDKIVSESIRNSLKDNFRYHTQQVWIEGDYW